MSQSFQINPLPAAGTAIPPTVPPTKIRENPHSRLGVASFATALTAWFLIAVILGLSVVQRSAEISLGISNPSPGAHAWIVPVIFSLYAATLVAVGLGIASLCERGKKRAFGILGLVLSSLLLLCTFFLGVLGARATSAARGRLVPSISLMEEDDQVSVTLEAAKGVQISDVAEERLRRSIENKIQERKLLHPVTRPSRQFVVAVTVQTYGDLPAAGPGQFEIDVAEEVYVMPGRARVASVGTGAVRPIATTKLTEIEEAAADAAAHAIILPTYWVRPPSE